MQIQGRKGTNDKKDDEDDEDIQKNIKDVIVKGDLSPRNKKKMRAGRKMTKFGKAKNIRSSSVKLSLSR